MTTQHIGNLPAGTQARRGLLASAGALLMASAVAVPAVAEASPDAEIIRLSAEYIALEREFHRLCGISRDWTGKEPGYRENQRQTYAIVAKMDAVEDELTDLTPVTAAGLRAMAEAALHKMCAKADEDCSPMDHEDNMAWVVCAALTGRA